MRVDQSELGNGEMLVGLAVESVEVGRRGWIVLHLSGGVNLYADDPAVYAPPQANPSGHTVRGLMEQFYDRSCSAAHEDIEGLIEDDPEFVARILSELCAFAPQTSPRTEDA
jgi:hypothetical protein